VEGGLIPSFSLCKHCLELKHTMLEPRREEFHTLLFSREFLGKVYLFRYLLIDLIRAYGSGLRKVLWWEHDGKHSHVELRWKKGFLSWFPTLFWEFSLC